MRVALPVSQSMVYMYRPDAVRALYSRELRERLPWYYSVMNNERPAKFMIARSLEAPLNPYEESDVEELWRVHDRLMAEFESLWHEVFHGGEKVEDSGGWSYLDVKIALARRMLDKCYLCEWNCGAERSRGRIGICRVGKECIVYSYFHHMGEEAPLVPSGTIFYGGCPFRCVFCQNWEISQKKDSDYIEVSPRELALIQESLRLTGSRNINHVGGDPTPHIPAIVESMKYLKVNVPQIWNSDMHLTIPAMKLIRDLIDLWLPDFKFGNDKCGRRLSLVKDYYRVTTRNLLIAYGHGDMIIRHLVLPGHIGCCTRPVVRWIARNTPKVALNLMDQYHPDFLVPKMPDKYREIARPLKRREFEEALRIAESEGFTTMIEDLLFTG
ncbi:MAG: radical SAM protein [Desulfurococcales archaeon]|nr:radical SAM protein [Desulfurococcales archaeon]